MPLIDIDTVRTIVNNASEAANGDAYAMSYHILNALDKNEEEYNALVDIQMCDDVLTLCDEELYYDEPFITVEDALAIEAQWTGTIDPNYDGEY